jgi:autotransporter-associated beta strand protein
MAKLNGGTLRLLGNSVAARWLQVDANGGTLEATQGVWAGNIANNADGSHTFNVAAATVATGAAVISGAISGNGSLTMIKVGSNPVQLTGANTYIGATTISGGTLSVATIGDGGVISGNLGSATSAASNLVLSNGTLQYTGATASSNRSFTITAGTTGSFDVTANTLTLSGASAATTGALTKVGNGTLILSGGNNHSGVTTISTGILSLANASALQNSALDTTNSILGNATNGLKTTATTLTIGGLTGNKDFSTVFTTTAGGYSSVTALTLNPQTGVSNSYSGIIANGAAAMTLTKNGSGTQTITGNNTYTGATTVSTGTLLINGSTSTSSAVTVDAGATLGGNGTVGGFTTVNGDLKPGNSPGVLTFSSGLTLNGTTTMEINGSATPGTDFDKVVVTSGTTTLGGALAFSFGSLLTNNVPINLFSFSGTSLGNFSGVTSTGSYSGPWQVGVAGDTWTFSDGTQTLTFSEVTGTLNVVPEPATWALLAFSLTTVMVLRRRRD